MNRAIRIFVLVSFCSCLLSGAGSLVAQDDHGEFYKIVEVITNVLAGKDVKQSETVISKGADLVWKGRLMNLKEVVTGGNKTFALADTSFHGVVIKGRTNTAEDMGIITLKTVKEDTTKVRYHTVVFLKDSTGEYRIISWNASGND